jgi:hypothetical protein
MCVLVLTVLLMYLYHDRSVNVCGLTALLMVLCHVVLFCVCLGHFIECVFFCGLTCLLTCFYLCGYVDVFVL